MCVNLPKVTVYLENTQTSLATLKYKLVSTHTKAENGLRKSMAFWAVVDI